MNDPVDKARFERGIERMAAVKTDVVYRIVPYMLVLECWAMCRAYYGSNLSAFFAIGRFQFQLWLIGKWTSFLLVITDGVGWTKRYKVPGEDYELRHGSRCSGSPNCGNMHCIEDSLPNWFKKLTRWEA